MDQSGLTVSRTEKITADTLLLRHNGYVYTHPRCLKDVPLEKIDRHHPYWENFWPDLPTLVGQIQLAWMNKYNTFGETGEKAKKYYYGRQVNRGDTILAFLANGKISPFQLLGKSYMTFTGKGSISSYNTLYQLCHTVEELLTFKIEVEPIDWLRQRLHAFSEEQGASFNLSRTISNFYHDPELTLLRRRSGFKSIGRPLSQQRDLSEIWQVRKRKVPHSNTMPEIALEFIGQLSNAKSYNDEGVAKRKESFDSVQSFRTRSICPSNGYTSQNMLTTTNPFEKLISFDWAPNVLSSQLERVTKTMADQKQKQELQLCRLKDMEAVHRAWSAREHMHMP